MADQRIHFPVRLVDDASPPNNVIPNVAALADATSNPTTGLLASLLFGFNGTTWDRLRSDSNKILQTGLFDSAGNRLMPVSAALADTLANPTTTNIQSMLMGFNGTTWDRLQVDSLKHLKVVVEPPTTPVIAAKTTAALASGSSTTLATADMTSLTRTLAGVDIAASVPVKATIGYQSNGVATTIAVLFGGANNSIIWRPPQKQYGTVTFAALGVNQFQAIIVNQDPNDTADVYATFYTET